VPVAWRASSNAATSTPKPRPVGATRAPSCCSRDRRAGPGPGGSAESSCCGSGHRHDPGRRQPEVVAVNPDTGDVGGTVPVISGRTSTVTATIPVGTAPYGVAVNPATGAVYVTNSVGGTVPVISERTSTVTATIRVGIGASPEGVAVNPDIGAVYVAASGSGVVWVISAGWNRPGRLAWGRARSSPRQGRALRPETLRVPCTACRDNDRWPYTGGQWRAVRAGRRGAARRRRQAAAGPDASPADVTAPAGGQLGPAPLRSPAAGPARHCSGGRRRGDPDGVAHDEHPGETRAMMCVYGDAGLGKTLSVNGSLRALAPADVCRVRFRARRRRWPEDHRARWSGGCRPR